MQWYTRAVIEDMGDIYTWDVINEPIDNSNDPEAILKSTDIYYKVDDASCKIFQQASLVKKELGYSTNLIINEYNIESDRNYFKIKSDKFFNFVKDLKDRNCGVEGVGFQSHFDLGYSDDDIEGIRSNINRYREIGLKVYMTEVDVRCGKGSGAPTHFQDCALVEGDVWTEEMIQTQADIYTKVLNVCLESPNCVEFTAWNFEDKYVSSAFYPPQDPFPFDLNLQPKLAWVDMVEALNSFNRTSDANLERLRGSYGFE